MNGIQLHPRLEGDSIFGTETTLVEGGDFRLAQQLSANPSIERDIVVQFLLTRQAGDCCDSIEVRIEVAYSSAERASHLAAW